MSAIWGAIHLNKQTLPASVQSGMEAPYYKYRIDRYSVKAIDHAVFGCCEQFLTPESTKETLPILDEERHLLFTADVFLDNRNELLSLLQEDKTYKLDASSPDGAILYAAYCRFGEHFTEYCLGAFTVAVYDYAANRFSLFTDHVNNRCMYYCLKDDCFYFSTILASITAVCPAATNRKWAAGCLATVSPDIVILEGSTPFEAISQLQAARHLQITEGKLTCSSYWNPLAKIPHPNFSKKVDYAQKVRKTIETCTSSLLRSADKTGCTMSSGLDSTTVACFAAKLLPKGQTLYSFTSVPLSGYESDKDAYYITDERSGVEAVCRQYPNIHPTYVECKGKNAFSELPRLIPLLEYPTKSLQNIVWLDEIYHTASQRGCRVLLKGQYGNCTLSYGNIMSATYQQLCSLRPLTAARFLRRFCQNHKVPFKKGCRVFLSNIKKRLSPDPDLTAGSLLKQELFTEYGIKESMYRIAHGGGGGDMDSRKERCRFLFNEQDLAQLSIYDTHFGLMYGLIIRDPLKDKRLIELCLTLPIECTVAGYVERAMVRTYMKGIVPDAILDNRYRRGLQSADFTYRMRADWDTWKPQIAAILDSPVLETMLDSAKFTELRKTLHESNAESLTDEFLQQVCVLYSCASYFLSHETKRGI